MIAEKIFTNRWIIIVPLVLFIIIGLLLWIRTDNKKREERIMAAALQKTKEERLVETVIPTNPLELSEQMLLKNETRQFYETIDKELHIFLADTLKLRAEAISKRTIADALDRSGITVTDSLAVQKLLDDIALQLYTPFADESKMQDYYVEAMNVVNRVGMLKATRNISP